MDGNLNTIRQGDCILGMKELPEGRVDLAFADPPFNIGYEYDVYDDAKDRSQYLNWSREWISGVHRVLKPTGSFWLAIGDEYAAELKLLSQEIGFHCRSWVIWYYTFGVNCKRKFSRSHAHLFHFVKDPERYTFRETEPENRIPSARQLVYGDSRANPHGRLPDDTWILRPQDLVDCFTPDEDTWYFPRVAGTFKERAGFHGCQMPEQLLARIIRSCSHENDLVLDPFSGSATTLTAAKKLGRQFLGFELSDEYVRRGQDRLASICRGDCLEGAPEPLVSAPSTPVKPTKKKAIKLAPAGRPEPQCDVSHALKPVIEPGLLEAFRRTNDGFSLDRVIADPDINEALANVCRSLGLPGDERTWNHTLFRMRKAGKLVGIPTQRRTEITWRECDNYLFASEIALRQILDRGFPSLDEILCDPSVALEFDQIARRFAPGYSSLQYRWAALKLRKEAKFARSRAKVLAPARLNDPVMIQTANWKQIPDASGVYLILGRGAKSNNLYVGEALNLRERLKLQFSGSKREAWKSWSSLQVRTFTAASTPSLLMAYQSLLVREHDPLLNYKELAAV